MLHQTATPDRHARPPRQTALVVLAVAGVGLLVGAVWPHERAITDPLSRVRPTTVYAQLREGAALDPHPTGNMVPPPPGERTRLVYWSQPSYGGTIDSASVDTLVRSGRAESLEFRLKDAYRGELKQRTAATDLALRDLGLVIATQEDAVKDRLRANPERAIVLRAKPTERDPRWPEVARLQAELKYPSGVLWGDACEEGTIYFVVMWSEYPGLKSLCDDRFALIAQRQETVRSAVAELHRIHGASIFD